MPVDDLRSGGEREGWRPGHLVQEQQRLGGGGGGASNWRGGGGRGSPLAGLPQKKAQLTAPQNPTETDPRAPEVTQTQKLAKNENGIFGISASRGVRKSIACHVFGEKENGSFSMLKKVFGAFSARFTMTDQRSCQLSPFPEPPPPPPLGNPTSPAKADAGVCTRPARQIGPWGTRWCLCLAPRAASVIVVPFGCIKGGQPPLTHHFNTPFSPRFLASDGGGGGSPQAIACHQQREECQPKVRKTPMSPPFSCMAAELLAEVASTHEGEHVFMAHRRNAWIPLTDACSPGIY